MGTPAAAGQYLYAQRQFFLPGGLFPGRSSPRAILCPGAALFEPEAMDKKMLKTFGVLSSGEEMRFLFDAEARSRQLLVGKRRVSLSDPERIHVIA